MVESIVCNLFLELKVLSSGHTVVHAIVSLY